jgi:hypothetical protein
MQEVDPNDSVRWLSKRATGSEPLGYCGFNAVGWEADTWILNAMYEHGQQTDITHQEVRQHQLEHGLVDPVMVGSVNLDERTVSTGIGLGLTKSPGPGWRRLRWSELADRVPSPMESSGVPPCCRWFSYSSWPANIRPPGEGSLDLESLQALIGILIAESTDGSATRCRCYFSPLAGGGLVNQRVFVGALGEIVSLSVEESYSPSNLWPEDGSWFVYTDADLSGTKVSGSADLISMLDACSELETLHLSG